MSKAPKEMQTDKPTGKEGKTLLIVIGLLILVAAIIYAVVRTVWLENEIDQEYRDARPQTSQQAEGVFEPDAFPAEPTNPNVTGGTSGGGTGQPNDSSIERPNPAGGIDADGDVQ